MRTKGIYIKHCQSSWAVRDSPETRLTSKTRYLARSLVSILVILFQKKAAEEDSSFVLIKSIGAFEPYVVSIPQIPIRCCQNFYIKYFIGATRYIIISKRRSNAMLCVLPDVLSGLCI